MRVLHLTLKKKWFDMVGSGEKKEEYREIKPYWIKRLCVPGYIKYSNPLTLDDLKKPYGDKTLFDAIVTTYDAICFARGGHFHSSIPQTTIECEGIEIRTGNTLWGAEPGKEYFVIKLGEIIK